MTSIYVDADACPVKKEIYKVAERYGLNVVVVSNSHMWVPERDAVQLVEVSGGFDAADDWIADHVVAGDIVITADIPLAGRSVRAGAWVLTPRGERLTEDNVCDAVATRDLMQQLREAGAITGGPRPFERKDRSHFLSQLDNLIHAARRGEA